MSTPFGHGGTNVPPPPPLSKYFTEIFSPNFNLDRKIFFSLKIKKSSYGIRTHDHPCHSLKIIRYTTTGCKAECMEMFSSKLVKKDGLTSPNRQCVG